MKYYWQAKYAIHEKSFSSKEKAIAWVKKQDVYNSHDFKKCITSHKDFIRWDCPKYIISVKKITIH